MSDLVAKHEASLRILSVFKKNFRLITPEDWQQAIDLSEEHDISIRDLVNLANHIAAKAS